MQQEQENLCEESNQDKASSVCLEGGGNSFANSNNKQKWNKYPKDDQQRHSSNYDGRNKSYHGTQFNNQRRGQGNRRPYHNNRENISRSYGTNTNDFNRDNRSHNRGRRHNSYKNSEFSEKSKGYNTVASFKSKQSLNPDAQPFVYQTKKDESWNDIVHENYDKSSVVSPGEAFVSQPQEEEECWDVSENDMESTAINSSNNDELQAENTHGFSLSTSGKNISPCMNQNESNASEWDNDSSDLNTTSSMNKSITSDSSLNENKLSSSFQNMGWGKKENSVHFQGKFNRTSEEHDPNDNARNIFGKEREGCNYAEYVKTRGDPKPDSYFQIVKEQEADLMTMPDEYCLAHCVAEDMNMGSGIAVQFRQKFKGVTELLAQSAKQGGLAVLENNDRYIYYLVTKRESNRKPTYETMFRSVLKMKEHMVENNVNKLAIPRIGCGLDRLEWKYVKFMLEYIFKDTDKEIIVCNFQKAAEKMSETKEAHLNRKCKVVTSNKSITEIESGTLILYLGSEDGEVTNEISLLDKKFNIINQYKDENKTVGSFFTTYHMNFAYSLNCLVIRKKASDPFDFEAFGNCIKEVNKTNVKASKKNESYYYVAMQKLNDNVLTSKVINILRNTFYNVEIHICEI